MNKTLVLVASLWLASPAAAQVILKITGSINGVTDGSNYTGPAPSGPGMVFFNGNDVWQYSHPTPPPPPTPTPPTPTPIPIPLPPPSSASTPNVIGPPPPVAPPVPQAPVAPQVTAAPVTAPTAAPDAKTAKALAAAAEARKKKFERVSKKLDALADKIGDSKTDAAKKTALLARAKKLAAQLKDPAGKLTLDAAEDAFTKLNGDFAEALERGRAPSAARP